MSRSREKFGWERLADVQVPRGILWVILLGLRWRQRATHQAIEEFAGPANELTELLAERWREGTEREEELLMLQASVERMTRWLVRLTVVLGIIGTASIAATTWAALS
jgi:hypothetical protein